MTVGKFVFVYVSVCLWSVALCQYWAAVMLRPHPVLQMCERGPGNQLHIVEFSVYRGCVPTTSVFCRSGRVVSRSGPK